MKDKKVVYATSLSTNSGGCDRLVLFDLMRKKSEIIFERQRDTQCIEKIKSFNDGVLFSVGGHECYKLNLKSGKLERIFEDIKKGYVNFTSSYGGRLVYSVNRDIEGSYDYSNAEGSVYLYNLKSKRSYLISKSDNRVGEVGFNGKEVVFTRIMNSSDGYTPAYGYEEKDDSRLEHLISLKVHGNSLEELGDIRSFRKKSVSDIAISNDGEEWCFVFDSNRIGGNVNYKWYKPKLSGIDYLNDNKIVVGGRFVSGGTALGEDIQYSFGFKILENDKIVREIETDDYINNFSVIR